MLDKSCSAPTILASFNSLERIESCTFVMAAESIDVQTLKLWELQEYCREHSQVVLRHIPVTMVISELSRSP